MPNQNLLAKFLLSNFLQGHLKQELSLVFTESRLYMLK